MTKTCTTCGETKPLEEFVRTKRNRDGRTARCKACNRAAVQAHRQRPGYVADENAKGRGRYRRYRADAERGPRVKWAKAISDAKRAAERYGVQHVPYTLADLEAVFGPVSQWTCTWCGTSEGLSLDHVRPLSAGGPDAVWNVVPACHRPSHGTGCNQQKASRPLSEWLSSEDRAALREQRYRAFACGAA
ncbi:hypothetical protein GCM10023214_10920 [Amycolatopsis dongchuanensis]|uniref:Stc1 domain-containing protein n=1 Tax=Amycolatopsis dongchuanensis TaxID=1070866 RepID=A0ABP9Q0X1_9PSEU